MLDYTERIRVNGQPISHEQLIELVEQVKPAVAKIPKFCIDFMVRQKTIPERCSMVCVGLSAQAHNGG
ncbi:MAG: hypothetical protein HY022_10555 [Chloroflexi bacterium]|nr:hypothetical protein [Chloroflexota bacterium]